MNDYEQMELNTTLESQWTLKENITKVIQFAYDKQNAEVEENGTPIQPVRNKHEGYGIAAEAWNRILLTEKDIKCGMNDYLGLLQVQGDDAIQPAAKLYEAAHNLAMNAIRMAVDMNRILNDLYYGNSKKTPIEEMIDGDGDDNEVSEEDGFEEAEPAAADEDESAGNEADTEGGEDE